MLTWLSSDVGWPSATLVQHSPDVGLMYLVQHTGWPWIGAIRYAYGTDFWSIKAQISTRRQIQAEPKASACIGDKYWSEPLSTKKQCHMHFIVRPPTYLTDNYNIQTTMRQNNVNNSQPEHKFWSIQEVISTSLVVDNTCGSTMIHNKTI